MVGVNPVFSALPIRVAHLEVAAGAGGILAAAFRAPDVLDLLAQALEGGVYLEVTVTNNIGIIGPVVAAAIVSLLLRWLGQEAEVETTAGRTRGTRRTRRARGTNRTGITSATTRTRGANGAWKTVQSIFARSTSRARGTAGTSRTRSSRGALFTRRAGRARGTLETGETTVTLYASVALFACLTLVTTGTLGSLDEKREQVVKWKVH